MCEHLSVKSEEQFFFKNNCSGLHLWLKTSWLTNQHQICSVSATEESSLKPCWMLSGVNCTSLCHQPSSVSFTEGCTKSLIGTGVTHYPLGMHLALCSLSPLHFLPHLPHIQNLQVKGVPTFKCNCLSTMNPALLFYIITVKRVVIIPMGLWHNTKL